MDSISFENDPAMSRREVRNLQTSLQSPKFAESTARVQMATARNQSRGRREPEMEEPKLPAGEPRGESKVNKLDFGKRESFTVKTKASDEELAEFDSVSLIAYLIDLHTNPNDKKAYEKQFFNDCSPHMEEGLRV